RPASPPQEPLAPANGRAAPAEQTRTRETVAARASPAGPSIAALTHITAENARPPLRRVALPRASRGSRRCTPRTTEVRSTLAEKAAGLFFLGSRMDFRSLLL